MNRNRTTKVDRTSIILAILVVLTFVAIGSWMFVSFIDIIADNILPNPSHLSWNFFTVLLNLVK